MLSLEFLQSNNSDSFPFEVCNLLLGKGGSGQVFLGRFANTENYVAIKKRYTKYDSKGAKGKALLPSDSTAAEEPQTFVVQGSQAARIAAFNGRSSCAYDMRSTCHFDCNEAEPLSQRHEIDLGEESVTQMMALSQQSSKLLLGTNTDSTAMVSPKPSMLTDEVSVLRYLGPHPQVVKFLGNYTTSKLVNFFTMELMDSDVARELKEANDSFHNESVCLAVAYSVLKALEHLHAHGVAHRDVKPGNILLRKMTSSEDWPWMPLSRSCNRIPPAALTQQNSESSASKNADPGLFVKAALGDFSAAHGVSIVDDTAFADTRGTLHYKSPEQLMGRRGTVSGSFTAVDMWGLGCTMYEMITGTCPFPGNSELQVLMSILDRMGSDIQSFPSVTKPCRLFHNLPVSTPFLDLLQQLLSLDATARPTAKEALRHPVFKSLRDAEERFLCCPNQADGQPARHILGIPLTLSYASFTHVPPLRFSRIACTALKAPEPQTETGNATDAPYFSYVASQTTVEGEAAALLALTHYAQQGQTVSHEEESSDAEKRSCADATLANADCVQQRSPDATMMSFMSESSCLHWSEIRPMAQPCTLTASLPNRPTPHSADNHLDQRTNGRVAVGLFGANSGKTPSPSTNNALRQQRQFSESSQHPSASMRCSTVARALNISDSSVKVARTERSSSHVDFDLSPVTVSQLFSADADVSTCIVPHGAVAAIPRPPLPVLQLKSGSTFTASNLRANSSFERDGNNTYYGGGGGHLSTAATSTARSAPEGAALNHNSSSTPRDSALLRTTAYAGRALCFSEETDHVAQRSTGSCPSQQSCLNSLLTSPAPLSRVHEGSSPHPSPIQPVILAVRSPSGVPVVERSGLSSDDSGVGLEWMKLGFDAGTVSSASAEANVAAAAAMLLSGNAGRIPPAEGEASVQTAAPVLSAARAELPFSFSNSGTVKALSASMNSESPHVRRCLPRSVTRESSKQICAPHVSSGTSAVSPPAIATCADHSAPGQRCKCNIDPAPSAIKVLPLPIPLSVAAGHQSSTPSRAPSALSSPQANPHTQRFLPVASASTSDQRCSGSVMVAAESASPDQPRHVTHLSQVLQGRDVNISSSLLDQKQRCFPGSGLTTLSRSPCNPITVPSRHGIAAAAAHSQRHCTPSSAEPVREDSEIPSCEMRQLSSAQLSSSLLFAEVPSLHLMGMTANFFHSPSSSLAAGGARAARAVTASGQLCGRESLCLVSPRSTRRSSHKRSREGVVNDEGQ
jgi:serine/threonine protein kinase